MTRWSRREFLIYGGTAVLAGSTALALPASASATMRKSVQGSIDADEATTGPGSGFLDAGQRSTLSAAVAQIVPATGPLDWSAADLGVVDYIDNLLSGFDRDPAGGGIYPGGPYRLSSPAGPGFSEFLELSRVKLIGWRRQVDTWRGQYVDGLALLDSTSGGDFAAAPSVVQELILLDLDTAGSSFFGALFDHTMEGTYSHPVYGGNRGARSWQWLGFAGDVHGVRFPEVGSRGAWNVYGGYAPEEIIAPGSPSTERPDTTPMPATRW
ncbi:MAG: gluconate 2-dehydrogenase subunit 3 family protein [Acidimicrobiales bacterium]